MYRKRCFGISNRIPTSPLRSIIYIFGKGEDDGVVYCEMLGRANSPRAYADLEFMRRMYPDCGNSAVTGGIPHNLRTSTTNKKVTEFITISIVYDMDK